MDPRRDLIGSAWQKQTPPGFSNDPEEPQVEQSVQRKCLKSEVCCGAASYMDRDHCQGA